MTRTKLTLTAAALALTVPAMAAAQSQGKAQLADILGVEPDRFTLSQLIRLDEALSDNESTEVRLILDQAGSDRDPADLMTGYDADMMTAAGDWYMADYAGGKEQLAETVGVPADEFTLAQLIRLDDAIENNDTTEIGLVLDEAGVDMSPTELTQ